MANIRLWSGFVKRKNSTKQPNDSDSIVVSAKLKETVSIETPIFIVNIAYKDYNYCQFEHHYYFIDDIFIITNSVIEVHCTKDLLATYKSLKIKDDSLGKSPPCKSVFDEKYL